MSSIKKLSFDTNLITHIADKGTVPKKINIKTYKIVLSSLVINESIHKLTEKTKSEKVAKSKVRDVVNKLKAKINDHKIYDIEKGKKIAKYSKRIGFPIDEKDASIIAHLKRISIYKVFSSDHNFVNVAKK